MAPPHVGHATYSAVLPTTAATVIPPFKESGIEFLHWRYRMKLAFRIRGLWKVVDGSHPEPDCRVDPDAYAEWFIRDRDAQQQLETAMNLNGKAMSRILRCKTAKESWDNLMKDYQDKNVKHVAHLMSDLYRSNLNESEPMGPQIDRILLTAYTLDALGYPIAEKLLAFQLVLALPDSMEVLKCILYQISPSDMNTDHVTMMILNDENRRVRASGKPATLFFSKAVKKGSGKARIRTNRARRRGSAELTASATDTKRECQAKPGLTMA